jgi:hypothetical protein
LAVGNRERPSCDGPQTAQADEVGIPEEGLRASGRGQSGLILRNRTASSQ